MSMRKKAAKRSALEKRIWIIIFVVLAILATVASLSLGSMDFTWKEVLRGLFVAEDSAARLILWNVRLPRTLGAGLVGLCLAIAGALLQGVMRNHLASPSTIGVSSGAAFVGYLTLVAFPKYYGLLPLGAMVGAFFTTLAIYSLAYERGVTPVKMILAGLAVSAVFGASSDMIKSFFPERVENVVGFLVGSMNGVVWKNLLWVMPYMVIGIFVSCFLWEKMNLLLLGDEVASSLGLSTESFRFLVIVLSSLLAGSSIAVAGLLPFVGLVVPHMARLLVGGDYRYLLPMSMAMGYAMVVFADTLGRILLPVGEISVSVIISFVGAPFFLYLLRKRYERY